IEGFLPTQADIEKAWLIRNERHFTLYNFDNGKGFQPDFVLFLQKQDNTFLTYQLFVEPKGEPWQAKDSWKEEFMQEINAKYPEPLPVLELGKNHQQAVIGLPFYNKDSSQPFMNALEEAL
ncbi:MAG: type III deoxyribonuclease, partial [Alphaproteobacteria bacterium]|nr:type III deoxyribonuclease [Alphaproteobacteria bacterium]